jgi:hypothetical protein
MSRPVRLVVAVVTMMLVSVCLPPTSAGARPGPYSGGPTHYFTSSNGEEIALSVAAA